MKVVDDKGREAYVTGRVDENGLIEAGTFMRKAEPVDQQGNLIDRHNLWEMVGVRHRRTLFPGVSDTIDFSFFCPEAARRNTREIEKEDIAFGVPAPAADSGWLDVTVRLRFREVSQYLLNFMFGVESGLTAPITDLAVASARIPVRRSSSPRGD